MSSFLRFLLLLLLGSLVKTAPPDTTPPPPDTSLLDTGTVDTGLGAGPCGDGGWGNIDHASSAYHVSPVGNDGFDGSEQYPFQTIERALLEVQSDPGWSYVAVYPGDFVVNIVVDVPHGVRIEGCGPDESVLLAANPTLPVVSVAPDQDVILAGLALVGGSYGLRVDTGAAVTVTNVRVEGATSGGMAVQGATSSLRVVDSVIQDITCAAGSGCGWGISADQAKLTVIGGTIQRTTEFGVVSYQSNVRLDGVTVDSVAPNPSGELGRAVQLQAGKQTVVGTTFTRSNDAAMVSLMPSDVFVSNILIDIIGAGLHNRGDGLVVAGRAGFTTANIDTSTLSNATRVPAVLQNLSADLNGNVVSGNGLADLMYLQGSVTVTGSDGGTLTVQISPGVGVDTSIYRPASW